MTAARTRDRRVYLAGHPVLFALLGATRRWPVLRLGRTLLVHDRQAYAAALTELTLDRQAAGTTGGAVAAIGGEGALFDQQGEAHRRSRRGAADGLTAAGVTRLRPLWTTLLADRLSPLAAGHDLDLVPIAAELAATTAAALIAQTSGPPGRHEHGKCRPDGPHAHHHPPSATGSGPPERRPADESRSDGPHPSSGSAAGHPSGECPAGLPLPHSGPPERHPSGESRSAGPLAYGHPPSATSSGPPERRPAGVSRAGGPHLSGGCPRAGVGVLAEAAREAAAAAAREHVPGLFKGRARRAAAVAAAELSAVVAPDGGPQAGLHAMLAVAAINTTVAALPRAAAWAADDELWDADPATSADELMRAIAPTPLLPRAAAADGELPPGHPVRAGDRLMLVARHAAGAHRKDPDPADPAPAHVAQLVFGVGPHACPGARLARVQMTDWLAALAPYRPVVVRARADRRSALPGWRSLVVRASA